MLTIKIANLASLLTESASVGDDLHVFIGALAFPAEC